MKSKKKINIIVIILIIILTIMIISLIFYSKFKYKDTYFNYNGFNIEKVNIDNNIFYYITFFVNDDPQPLIISTKHDPRSLENIPVEGDIKNPIIKNNLYVCLNKDTTGPGTIAGIEISKITNNKYLFNIPTHSAISEPVERKNITIKNCDNVNEKVGIILFKLGENNKIYNDNNCIIIEGKNENELIKGADRFILTLLEIMSK